MPTAIENHRQDLASPVAPDAHRLGNPNKVEGNIYTWLDGKPDSLRLTAVIENGLLTSANCL